MSEDIEAETDKHPTRYKKGQSGNLNGAPRGPRKGMTTQQRATALSKGSKKAMDTILALMDDKNSNVKIKAAVTWVTEDIKFRELLMKEIEHKMKMKHQEVELKQKKLALKEAGQTTEDPEQEDNSTPVISLKAI